MQTTKKQIEQAYSQLTKDEIDLFSKLQMHMDLYRQNFNIYDSKSKEFFIFNAIHSEVLLITNVISIAPGIYSGEILKTDCNKHFNINETVYFYKDRIRKMLTLKDNGKNLKCISINYKDVKFEEDIQVEIEEMGGED